MGKYKIGTDSHTYLIINLTSGKTLKRFSIDWGNYQIGKNQSLGIQRLEKYLKQPPFKWAVLYCNNTKKILHYYHHSRDVVQLSKQQYQKILSSESKTKLKIYIVPSRKARRQGIHKGTTKLVDSLKEAAQYYSDMVDHIQIYQAGVYTHQFNKRGFVPINTSHNGR